MRWLLLALALSACTDKMAARMPTKPLDSRPAIIFIHGYYGSALRDTSTKQRVFLSAKEVLFGRKAYSLYQKELGTPPGPELEPEGLFDQVSVLPYLYSVDVYGKFLEFASGISNVQLVPIVYDWRGDLAPAVAKLAETVRALHAAGSTRIAIVGHSMGGMVAAYYLGYGTQPLAHAKLTWEGARQVEHVFFLGTPFRGAFSIFRNLQRGADFAWNSYLLPTEAVASFPASYTLLPQTGTFFNVASGQVETRSVLDYSFWHSHRLGLLASATPAFAKARDEFTRAQLARVELLQNRFSFAGPAMPNSLKVTNVVNHTADTVNAAFYDPAKSELLFDVDDLKSRGLDRKKLLAAGDGTVTAESATLPAAFATHAKIIDSRMGHDQLFHEPRLKTELQLMFSQRKE